MIPAFAVVGRTNKGKSSIVATLTENDRILVQPTPRTTAHAQGFTFKVDGEPLFTVYDTPGFEEAPAILEWLKSVPVSAHQRRERIMEFYNTFHGTETFTFECELLKPILEGAVILYVADASHPYRPNFEAEFEILQWTGQPSIALLNQIGEGRFEEEWQRALEQYFRKVRVFNAHSAWIHDRILLIEELRFLSDAMREPLAKAASAMRRQQDARLEQAARWIGEMIRESLTFEMKVGDVESPEEAHHFKDRLRDIEQQCRKKIARLYGFHDLDLKSPDVVPGNLGQDLFSRETWEIFGLTRTELLAVGAASGAIAGGTVDAMVGGTSFMVGTGIGGLLGSLSSAYLAFSDPEIAGFKLGRTKKTMGPYKDPNFPWVLVDRQIGFVKALLLRTHAQRGELDLENQGKTGASSRLRSRDKGRLGFIFQSIRWKVRWKAASSGLEQELVQLLKDLTVVMEKE